MSAPLASARNGHTATLLPSGKLLVVGGASFSSSLSSAELFDPATGSWSSTGWLGQARRDHAATRLASGKVLVTGGEGPNGFLGLAEIYDPASGSWLSSGSLLQPRKNHTMTLLRSGEVLITGGEDSSGSLSSTELYDPATGLWLSKGSLAQARTSATATLLPSGKVLVVGGADSSGSLSSTELYDPTTGSWSPTGSLAQPRKNHAAMLLPSGKVLVVGGADSSGSQASAELYDPATGSWSSTGSLAQARSDATATLLTSGKVLVAGGAGANDTLASAEVYDPATGSWSSTPALSLARRNHTATLLPTGMLLVVGGSGSSAPLASTELYNPAAGSWTGTGPASHRYGHATTLLPSGKVLVVGGYNNNTYLNSAELYDPVTRTWTAIGSLAQRRYAPTATLLPSGKVLVVGGTNQYSGGQLASAELYDPATGSWTPTGSLAQGRSNHTATLLPSGKVLVVGGYGFNVLTSAELYDPATGSWSSTGSLALGRDYHTATLLPSGKVLIVGGLDETNFARSSAELYDPATGIWTTTASLAQPRYEHTATLLPSGKVLAVGGAGNFSYTTSVEVYDPVAGSWTPGASLHGAQFNHVAALLPSGKVLVAGGFDGTSSVNSELYDPATGSWTVTASLPQGPYDETATLLSSGQVLLTGGSSFNPVVYDDTGADPSWRPELLGVSAGAPLVPGSVFTLNGSRLRGLSEASGGATRSSPTDAPVLTLLDVERDTLRVLPAQDFSSTHVTASVPQVPPGHYLLSVTVNGLTASTVLAIAAAPDTTPPTATLTSPSAGAMVAGTVTLSATALDNFAVDRVEFYDGNTLLGADTAPPFSLSWNTTTTAQGPHVLSVRAFDSARQSATSNGVGVTVDNDVPVITLTSPKAGATLTGTVTFTVTASDSSGISQVAFFVGSTQVGTATSAPYSFSYNTRNLSNGTQSLTARAYDALNNVGVSTPVSVTFDNDLTPPTVALTSPAAGSTLAGTVALAAIASDNVAVTQVEFYDGAALLGTVTTAPYGISWDTRGVANGAHVLTAKAYDAVGQSTTSTSVSVTVYNDEVAPSVAFTAPAAGASVKGTITLTAAATDNVAVTRVEFYDGDTRLGSDTLSPYTYSWNTLTSSTGEHTLTAKAFDGKANIGIATVTVTVDNDFTPPTVELTAPGEGETVSGTVVLTATASDNKAVTRVAFFVGTMQVGSDSTAPYSFSYNTRLLPNGAKVLTAKAYDAANNVGTSAPVNVSFDNDFIPPTVTLTSPAEGETLSGTVTFTASASDMSGISKVAFFVGATQVGSDTTEPYSYSYNTRLLTNGAKVLTAKAYDAFNNVATSAAVNVTFDNDFTPPTVTLTSPAEGETLSGTVTFTASASDMSGISKVAFFVGTLQVGSDTTEPYSYSYNTRLLTNGAKVLTAKAYDAFNNVATSVAVNVTFDNDFTPPVTALTSPAAGSTVSGVVQLSAAASDDRGTIAKVDFYRGGALLGTVTSAPYTWTWDTTKATVGTTTLKTRAWDAAGNSAYSADVTVTVTR